jgi:hypothetical protein
VVAKLQQIERLFQFDIEGIRVRREAGCDKCRRANLPDLNGIRGRVMAAEMFEPDELDLMYIRDARAIELQAHQREKRVTVSTYRTAPASRYSKWPCITCSPARWIRARPSGFCLWMRMKRS